MQYVCIAGQKCRLFLSFQSCCINDVDVDDHDYAKTMMLLLTPPPPLFIAKESMNQVVVVYDGIDIQNSVLLQQELSIIPTNRMKAN